MNLGKCATCGYVNESATAMCSRADCALEGRGVKHPCSVCGKEMIVGPGITDPKGISVRCPYLDWEWHKEAAADITKQHPTLHAQWERKNDCLCGLVNGFHDRMCPKYDEATQGALRAAAAAQYASDPVNPAHYQGDYVMRIIEDFKLGFCLGNVVKYVLRAENKDKVTDLGKAEWYLKREIEARRK